MQNSHAKIDIPERSVERKFVPKLSNFKVSASYEGLIASGKSSTLEALKRQYAR